MDISVSVLPSENNFSLEHLQWEVGQGSLLPPSGALEAALLSRGEATFSTLLDAREFSTVRLALSGRQAVK